MSRRPRPQSDGITSARLDGIARRHASAATVDVEAAIIELREVAGDRPDLLAEAAGLELGFHRTALDFESHFVAAALLIQAGADVSKMREWIKEGQLRASQPHHFSPH